MIVCPKESAPSRGGMVASGITVGNGAMAGFGVVGAIGGHLGDIPVDLIEQTGEDFTVAPVAVGDSNPDDVLGGLVDGQMDLAPSTVLADAVLPHLPFPFTEDVQPRRVHHHVRWPFARPTWSLHRDLPGAPGHVRMVRCGKVQMAQAHQRIHNPSVARYGNWNRALIVRQVWMAVSEYSPGLPRPTGGAGVQLSLILASSNQIAEGLPRLTSDRSYSDQFVTRYRCFDVASPVSGLTLAAIRALLYCRWAPTQGRMPLYCANAALRAKAKEAPGYRFYLLYHKVHRPNVLDYAYRSCKANKGAAGADGVRFEDIEAYGEERWLGELAERLKKKDYRPEAVKRVWIPKPNGKLRPLGIPTITDRVVQTAAMLVLEPIFEADLQPEQYAYRAERGAQDAVKAVHRLLNTGHRQVIDADLSGYFDSIPHLELMKRVARRIVDRHVLHLIKQWLEAPVEEDDGHGHRQRSTSNRDTGRGTPQGAPISPLLSNLYMRRFILGWKTLGYARRWSAQIVNYADDFVICCKGRAEDAMDAMRGMVATLTVNDNMTHLCQIPQEQFDFLGYTFGRCCS
jgi:group II intron reverse transcriptase/maturase